MILEHKHINYANGEYYKIITDSRILKAFKNRNYIKDYDKNHSYVDAYDCYNCKDYKKIVTEFNYKNDNYAIRYFDGCFSPFVIKIINK